MKKVACLGSGNGKSGEILYDSMIEVGRILAEKGVEVLTGGFGGSGMEAPAKGAQSANGKSTGFTLMGIPGNEYLTNIVDCSLESDCPEIQFGIRLGHLLSADAFVIGAGGGPGTMVELMSIINLNGKFWKKKKRVVILHPSSFQTTGWDASMIGQLKNWGMIPEGIHVFTAPTPQDAVNYILF